MTFYKRNGEELLQAPNFVIGPDVELRAETHAEHSYPVDGWYWFDTLDEAMRNMQLAAEAVTMQQARIALSRVGKLTLVDAAIASLPEPIRTEAQIKWEYSNEVQRHNGVVALLGPALGLTEAEIDALFALARTL